MPAIRERLDALGCTVPLVGDFHFNGHKLLAEVPDCARALAKFRINPGNVGKGSKRDPQFAVMIEQAIEFANKLTGEPIRAVRPEARHASSTRRNGALPCVARCATIGRKTR